jgi:hypothetical protein
MKLKVDDEREGGRKGGRVGGGGREKLFPFCTFFI